MSVSGHRDSIGSTISSASRHLEGSATRYISKLDEGIKHLAKVRLEGGRTGTGHESASSVARRLGEAGHVFALLEKCFLQTGNTDEGLRLFASEMKKFLTTSWRGHYAGKEAKLDAKIDDVLRQLLSHSEPYTGKLARRAEGFKEALVGIQAKGLLPLANEHHQGFEGSLRNLEDRLMAHIRHRSEGKSKETSRLVADVYEDYGAKWLATGGPLVKLHDQLCKSEMRAANPREIQFMLVRDLASRLHLEKGYTPEDATRKAFHITQELFKVSKDEIAAHFDHITGYVQAAGVDPGYVKQERALNISAPLAEMLATPAATPEQQGARLHEMRQELQRNRGLDESLRTALRDLPSGTSSAAIASKLSPPVLQEMIRTCLASHADMGAGYDRTHLLDAVVDGFTARFVNDASSVLLQLIPAGKKDATEKLAKVGLAIRAEIDKHFSDHELEGCLKERRSFNGATPGSLGASDRHALVRHGIDQAVASSRRYEAAWQLFEEKVDQYMTNKKDASAYKSSAETINAIFADTPDIGERLVRGYYETAENSAPNGFQLECFHRLQGILARKDEDYYFRNTRDPEKGKTKSQDLFKEIMGKLGVTNLASLDTIPCGEGRAESFTTRGKLTPFEQIRREAVLELAPWRTSPELVKDTREYLEARDGAHVSRTAPATGGVFSEGVLGEYGVTAEARFVLDRTDSRLSLSSMGSVESTGGFDEEVVAGAGDERRIPSPRSSIARAVGEPLQELSTSDVDVEVPLVHTVRESVSLTPGVAPLVQQTLDGVIEAHAEDSPRPVHATIRRSGSHEALASVEGAEAPPIGMTSAPVEEAPAVASSARGNLMAALQDPAARLRLRGAKKDEPVQAAASGVESAELPVAPSTMSKPAAAPVRGDFLASLQGDGPRNALKAVNRAAVEKPAKKPSAEPLSLAERMKQAMEMRRSKMGERPPSDGGSTSSSDDEWE